MSHKQMWRKFQRVEMPEEEEGRNLDARKDVSTGFSRSEDRSAGKIAWCVARAPAQYLQSLDLGLGSLLITFTNLC